MNVHDVSLLVDTYICEQIRFPPIRNKIRTKILDEHLENTLRIATIKPDIDELVSKKQTVFSLKMFIFF